MPEPTVDWSFDELMAKLVDEVDLGEMEYNTDCINFAKKKKENVIAVQVPMKTEECVQLTDLLDRYFEGIDSSTCAWYTEYRRTRSIRALFYYNLTKLLIKKLEQLLAERTKEKQS